jgi:hypothetical protein
MFLRADNNNESQFSHDFPSEPQHRDIDPLNRIATIGSKTLRISDRGQLRAKTTAQ